MRRICVLVMGLLIAVGLPLAGHAATVRTVTATLSPTSSVPVGVSRAYTAEFATDRIKPGAYSLVLPESASKPVDVSVTADPGCRPTTALVVEVASRWTVSGLLVGCPVGADFRVAFATAFSGPGSASISWTVGLNPLASTTRSGTFPAITVTEHPALEAMPRGEVVSWVADLASPRDDVPLLVGSGANDFRLTWTSPRPVPDPYAAGRGVAPTLAFTFLPAFSQVRGYDIGGTCQVGEPEVTYTASGAKVVTFADPVCAEGDTVVLRFIGVGSLPAGPHEFRAVLSESIAVPVYEPFPPDEVAVATVQAVSPSHRLVITEAPDAGGDPYKRSITVTVLGTDGEVDTGYAGVVQFDRARCGIPGLLGPGGSWPSHPVVDGQATFTITSYDLGQTFTTSSGEEVVSPRSTDAWYARLGSGTALMSSTTLTLGPEDAPTIEMSDGYQCPTRSGF
jgi:uncharacterized protein YndB with AHSA1/START domain